MSKYMRLFLFLGALSVLGTLFFVKETVHAEPIQPNSSLFYSVIKEDGSVELHSYNEVEVMDYFSGQSEDSDKAINKVALEDIEYGVARIIGYTAYNEYDGTTTKAPRSGYTHGTSANDAAFIKFLDDGKTVRVKQAGLFMDIPSDKVEVTEYNKNSKVSYYLSLNGDLYHYYYYGAYGSTSKRASTMVGYTPSYLKDNVKYYSYDGHYFYNDYETMIDDYKKGVNVNSNAINKNKPYYNYYQYLSFRAPSQFDEKQIKSYINKSVASVASDSKLLNQEKAFKNTEKLYGINSSLMLGVAINESAWGTSYYATSRNNLFGLNAVDDNPNDAYYFDSVEECLYYFGSKTISSGFLAGDDYRYRGSHLGDKESGVNVYYSSDPYWGEKAASFSYKINQLCDDVDYHKYEILISQNGNVKFYKETDLENIIYSSGAAVNSNTNYFVYNIPFTVIEEKDNSFKIYSDTILKDNRNYMNVSNPDSYNALRDYVYVDKNEVKVIYDIKNKVEEVALKGDVNNDHKVSSIDYILIKNHIMNVTVLEKNELKRADVNEDGKISSIDYIMIKNHIMGKNKLF